MASLRILLVDDEPDIRRVAELTLRRLGSFEVEAVGSGREAIAAVQRQPPDLVLLDATLPEMDGPEILAQLRKLPGTGGIPVVFLTARCLPADVARYAALGAAAVIPKPFDPLELPQRLHRILEDQAVPEHAR